MCVCVCADAKSLPGISQPFPNIFDPAALLARAASSRQPIRELRRWREAEITHGRVAMLASLGFIVQEQLEDFPVFYNIDGHITGEYSCELCFAFLSIDAVSTGATETDCQVDDTFKSPIWKEPAIFVHVFASNDPKLLMAGPAIYHFQQVEARGAVFWEPLIFVIALAEAYRVGLGWANPRSEDFNFLREDYEPGNLGFDPLGLLPSDPAAKKDLQTKELNNGRLAMIAIAAFVVQELVSGEEVFAHTFKKLGL